MRIKSFEWNEGNVSHIARHNVTPEEVEETCFNDPLILKARGNRYLALGRAESGRYLTIVFEVKFGGIARVITARDMMDRERRYYRRIIGERRQK